MELLVVEDDQRLGKALKQGLVEAGHDCTWVLSGERGLQLARTQQFDAIVLDLLLPDRNGLTVVQSIREEGNQTPVLILTALGSIDDRVRGLQRGGDDYLVKPFDFAELLARLQAICRRTSFRPSPRYCMGDVELDLSTRKVTRGDAEIDLSPTEFSVLEFLMRHAGQVVTRKMLNEHIWGEDWQGITNVIDVHINRLRRKLDRNHDDSLIHTVRGRGYVFRTA